ncbi:MAG: MATE family efflux transporter [Angelakisella sp.]|jgi:putative MATE family efflux protein|nr:MATE family efflux transporter [Angelakisella sp.]
MVKIQLSDHFTYSKLLRFVYPSIVMMVFTSIYSVVDGYFVSNFVGKTPFAALNLIFPVAGVFGAVGFMVGTGGSAIVARTLGEGRPEDANRYFSMMVEATVASGVVLTLLALWLMRPIAVLLKAEGEMLEYSVLYGCVLSLGLVPFMLQNVFQSFLVAAERPKLGLAVTAAAGVTNMVLDLLFIAVFRWGLAGAAAATALSQAVGGVIPLVYFISGKNDVLRLSWAKPEWRVLLDTCTNGFSEVMSNISSAVVGILYNLQLMRLAGENGVAAFGTIMYVNFFFLAISLGYSIGSSPIISYHYGAENYQELQGLFKKSMLLNGATGLVMTAASILFAKPVTAIFVGYDPELFALTSQGFLVYSLRYLFSSIVIFGSGFFTALGDGLTSAVISFLRAIVFQVASILLLPVLFGVDGIWLVGITAETLAVTVAAFFFWAKRDQFHYIA